MDSHLITRTKEHLFSSPEEMKAAGLTQAQCARLLRLRELYVYWLENPLLPDSVIVSVLRERHHIGTTQAYEDVKLIRLFLGEIQRTTKDFLRWKWLQHMEEGFALARETKDATAYARLQAVFVKGAQLDKEDLQRADYSEITPQNFELTDNPETIGLKRIPNLDDRISTMLKKYAIEAEEVDA